MFNIGGPELLVILLLALIVLGPSRLPDAARSVGKAMAEVRKLSTGFQNEVKTAFEEVDPRSTLKSSFDTTATEQAPPPPPAPAEPATAVVKKAAPRKRSAPLRAAPKPTSKQ